MDGLFAFDTQLFSAIVTAVADNGLLAALAIAVAYINFNGLIWWIAGVLEKVRQDTMRDRRDRVSDFREHDQRHRVLLRACEDLGQHEAHIFPATEDQVIDARANQ